MARYPRAMELVAEMFDGTHPRRHWCRIDGWLRNVLMTNGVSQHVHGEVGHVGDNWPSHGCVPRPS